VATPEALATLDSLRRHPDAPLRQYALEALVATQQPEVLPWLIEALADEDNAVFGAAAQGLGQFSTQAVPVLCELLSNPNAAPDARCVAAWQLGEVAGHEAVPVLVAQLRAANPTDVLALCLWALGEIGHHSPEVLAVLQWGKQQADPEIRLRAEAALKKVVRAFN
jgi:HEAT repeat protein